MHPFAERHDLAIGTLADGANDPFVGVMAGNVLAVHRANVRDDLRFWGMGVAELWGK